MGRALQDNGVDGALCEILQFLLTSIFQLQEEEEDFDIDQDVENTHQGTVTLFSYCKIVCVGEREAIIL